MKKNPETTEDTEQEIIEQDEPSEVITDMIKMYDKLKFQNQVLIGLSLLYGVSIIYLFWIVRNITSSGACLIGQ